MSAQRLFFALWPSDALRAQLAAAAAPIVARGGGRPIPPENLHITLAFLGSVPAATLSAVLAAAASVESVPLRLSVARVEVWASAGILCLTPAAAPLLTELADRLRLKLLAREVEPDQKEAFRPHVTLARDWRERSVEGSIGPFEWVADDFALIESTTTRDGSRYRVVQRWPLTGARHS